MLIYLFKDFSVTKIKLYVSVYLFKLVKFQPLVLLLNSN